jgi:hypothetical protein
MAVIDKRLTHEEIHSLVARAELLIGKPLGRLIEKHAAAVATGVPPRHRHRLIELLLQLRAAADLSNELLIGAAAANAAELNAALDLYDAWSHSAAWRDFQRALSSPSDYLHAFATLSVANMLRIHHPAVELVAISAAGRTPDLMLTIPNQHGLAVEVKAPQAMWQRESALEVREAMWMVRNCLGSAGTGVRGQLAAGRPGILVIAGFLLSDETFDGLQHGAEVALQTQDPRRPDLLGIALFNLRMRVELIDGRVQVLLEEQSRLGRSPHYSGRLQLVGDWGKAWRLR